MSAKTILIIMDGWGIAKNPLVSAIDKAHTPFIDSLYKQYPHSYLQASGEFVGLPSGQMGNSEVGHMNLGAGRIIYQHLLKINRAIVDGSFAKILQPTLEMVANTHKTLHLIGLASNGGVHSHIEHLKAILKTAHKYNLKNQIFIHAFTDGRDTDPKSGLEFLKDIQNYTKETTGTIASVIGRYYSMDRDKHWDRVQKAYNLLIKGIGTPTTDILNSINNSYQKGITDEFIEPLIAVDKNKNPLALIKKGDVVLFFNFRTDRARQLTEVLTQTNKLDFGMQTLDLHFTTLTNYDPNFHNINILYNKDLLKNTLGEVLEQHKLKQIRIAETEKYPHVTYFFSGGKEELFEGERRLICPSPKVATYDLKPEMSAYDIVATILPELESQWADFICLNFANPDMVGHTGIFEAAVKACETVDKCVSQVVQKALEKEYIIFLLADHGNSDCMINPDGSPNTAHTTEPVPFFVLQPKDKPPLKNGILADVAPTILKIMGLPIPPQMTGQSLL